MSVNPLQNYFRQPKIYIKLPSKGMYSDPGTFTVDVDKIAVKTGNVYESVSIIGQRARQISSKMKEELSGKLSEFASSVDNLEEIFENREQIEISKYYERMPKPSALAIDDFLTDKVDYRLREEGNEEK
jgi:DNA-directed RNA polymerase subunit K/omega